jgi:putative DNA primase/helicase
VAFDAGNLAKVAERVRGQLPRARLVIAADNDRWTTTPIENPGVHYAKAAAREVGAALFIPEFKDLATKPTDFNDLQALEGIQAVLDQLQPKPKAEPANDNIPAAQKPSYDIATVDWYSPFPDINGKGKPISTIENVAEACRRLGTIVRYNVIRKDLEILIPGESFTIDNRANASLAWVTSACNRFGIPAGNMGEFLGYLSDKNLYNPVANWITSRPWDGRERLRYLYNTIRAEGEEDDYRVWDLKAAMMRRWLISAVAAAFNPTGVSAHGVLVLQGDQYLGKTKWFKSLVPAEMGVIADGLMLRTDDKDSVKTVVSNWLVELGELDATFRKSDIAALKAFLTKDRDILRRPYAKLESEYARRTVFFASVNARQFLHDPTGNRRYWTISATEINHDHDLDMQQVWAEVYEAHYLKGETWFLSPDEMAALNSHNRDHEVLDPIRERIMGRLDWDCADTMQWRWMTATDVMTECGFDRPTRADVTHAGQLIQELNGKRRKIVRGKALAMVPPRIDRGPHY